MVDYSGSYANPRLGLGAAFIEYMADGFNGPEFVGSKVLPFQKSKIRAGSYSSITRETILANPDAAREIGGDYNRVVVGAKDKTFTCKEYGVEVPVDDAERAMFGAHGDFDAEAAATIVAGRNLMVAYERRVAAAVFNTTTWTGAPLFLDNSASPWATITTDIIGQVLAAREKVRANVGMYPNALIVSAAQLTNMLKNTGIRNQFPGQMLITLEMIQRALVSIFGLTKLIVGGAVYNSAKEGQSFSGSDVWSNLYAMVARVADEGDPLQTPCVGRTILWQPDSPEDLVVESYREEQRRSDIIRTRHQTAEQIHDAYFGFLMKVA